jgi:HemY protein
LTPARKNNTVTDEWATRADAALLAAEGYGAFAGGDTATALDDTEKALKTAPGLLPAALLAARIHQDAGRSDRAARALESAFAATPDINIVEAYNDLFGVLEPAKKAVKFERLAARNPGARAAQVARAHAHIENGKNEEAVSILEKLIATSADAIVCAVMAEAVDRAYGAEAARVWLERAATSAGKPALDFDAMAALDRDGWAGLVREYAANERLTPPRLEAVSAGMPLDEIKLLSKPPAPPEPDVDEPEVADVNDTPLADDAKVAAPEAATERTTAPTELTHDASPRDVAAEARAEPRNTT